MTDTTTLGPSTGGLGHLKLHAPESDPCPFRHSLAAQLPNLASLNRTFQLATGWELDYLETASSYADRVRLGNPDFPAIGELSIVDLSPLLPPGIPAVSRIYCERLISEFNLVIRQLAEASRQSYRAESHQVTANFVDEASRLPAQTGIQLGKRSMKGQPMPPLAGNLAYRSSGFAFTPMMMAAEIAVCDWQIDDSGTARFVTVVCQNRSESSTRELIAVRSTFHSECRHGSTNAAIYEAIRETIDQFFDDTESLMIVIGSMNPLSGDVTMVGDSRFQARSTRHVREAIKLTKETETKLHLPAGHHLSIQYWTDWPEVDELDQWLRTTMKSMYGKQPSDLKEVFQARLSEAIPGLPADSALAFAVSRL